MPKPPLPDEVAEFLRGPNYATISMLKSDGSPVSVPTWYLFENGRVLVNMDNGRQRIEWLRRDPRAALSAMDPDDWITASNSPSTATTSTRRCATSAPSA